MEIRKFSSQLSTVLERLRVRRRGVLNTSARMIKSLADNLQRLSEELRIRENKLRELVARSRDAIIATRRKVAKLKVQLSIPFKQGTAHLRRAQNTFAGLMKTAAEKTRRLEHLVRTRENALLVLAARSRDEIVTANCKIAKLKAQLYIVFKQGTARLRQAQNRLTELVTNIVDKRQRWRQGLRARESLMRELLANSVDAIGVINIDHRFVAANRRALDLFGVSETNLSKFSIDVFLSRGQIPDLHWSGSSFAGREERHGKCMIRRLDGSLRTAEFAFVANFVPLLHLCRFYDVCIPPRSAPMHQRI